MELIIEEFVGKIINPNGEDISYEISQKFGLEMSDDGLGLVDCLTIRAQSPEENFILRQLTEVIKQWLKDAQSELVDTRSYPTYNEGKEYVC